MQHHPQSVRRIAALLAALAGFVDAIAFAGLGTYFASFMSGNTTRLGAAIADGAWDVVRVALGVLFAFIAGVVASTAINVAFPRRSMATVMLFVAAILTLAGLIGVSTIGTNAIVLTLLAMAMGAENGVLTRDGVVTVGVTYFTGNLVKMGQGLGAALLGRGPRWGWTGFLWLWFGFVVGVVGGATAVVRWDTAAVLIAAGAAALIAALLWRVGDTSRAG